MADDRGIFEQFEGQGTACADAAMRHDDDMREAMRLLMTRREGRVFLRGCMQNTTDISHLRSLALLVMGHVEGTYV